MAYYRRSARRSRGRRRSSFNRPTTWARFQQNAIGTVGTAGNRPMDLLPNGVIDPGAVVGSTVTRIHASINYLAGAKTTAYGVVITGVFVGERTTDASTIAQPFADSNSVDWMYWRAWSLAEMDLNTLVVNQATTENSFAYAIDVKSQRRITQPNQTLYLCMQDVSLGLGTISVSVAASTLLRLG